MRASILGFGLTMVLYAGQVLAGLNHEAIIASKLAADQLMFPNHNIYTLSWSFELNPGTGGPTAIYNGTIQHAMQQMEEAHPGWTQKYDAYVATKNKASTLEKRSDHTPDDYWRQPANCDVNGHGWPSATWGPVTDGVTSLRNHDGPGGIGNKGCGRVSCSCDSGIWICNDDPRPLSFSNWVPVAEGADYVSRQCTIGPLMQSALVKGQALHDFAPNERRELWDVIVRGLDDRDSDKHC